MKEYTILTARLNYNQKNELLKKVFANSLDEVKEIIKKPINENGLFKNPAYTTILINDEVIYNQHLPIYR
jgi:hypothetical protein